MNKVKQQIQATFDEVSCGYDHNRFFSISAKKLISLLPSTDSLNILDLSTGTGIVALELAKKYPKSTLYALDFSAGMLEKAKQKAAKAQISHIKFIQQDVEKLAFDTASFDLITCGYGLFFYPNMEKTYQLIIDKIKPRGIFAFSVFTPDAFQPFAELFLKRLERDYAIAPPKRSTSDLKTIQQIKTLAAFAKYQKITIESYSIRYQISPDDWWSMLNNAGYKGLISALSPQQLKTFKSEHLKEVSSLATEQLLDFNADSYLTFIQK